MRVGYVSSDFRKHVVAYFALPLLEGHHSDRVEVVCYYNHRQDDEWTRRFKGIARHWADCVDLDDDALATRMRADGIDILVDLACSYAGSFDQRRCSVASLVMTIPLPLLGNPTPIAFIAAFAASINVS